MLNLAKRHLRNSITLGLIQKSIILLSISITFVSCYIGASRFSIRDYQHVEGIYIGMPVHDAVKKAGKRYRIVETPNEYIDGNFKDFKVYHKNDRDRFLFSFNGGFEENNMDKVYRILVIDPAYLTTDGVHTGMTLKELRNLVKLESADFNYSDGLFIRASNFDGGFWMELEGVNTNKIQLQPPRLKSLPGHLRIKAIALF